ncbi:MAG TPA: hypothetical protein PKM56_18530 [Candidatus Rifleibacterium sp.]|nr:hypothetical protein [Candidatus Rifleibacterium sp.]
MRLSVALFSKLLDSPEKVDQTRQTGAADDFAKGFLTNSTKPMLTGYELAQKLQKKLKRQVLFEESL